MGARSFGCFAVVICVRNKRMMPIQPKVWVLLTAVMTFIVGFYSTGDTLLLWAMLSLWLFRGFLFAACKPGERPAR